MATTCTEKKLMMKGGEIKGGFVLFFFVLVGEDFMFRVLFLYKRREPFYSVRSRCWKGNVKQYIQVDNVLKSCVPYLYIMITKGKKKLGPNGLKQHLPERNKRGTKWERNQNLTKKKKTK